MYQRLKQSIYREEPHQLEDVKIDKIDKIDIVHDGIDNNCDADTNEKSSISNKISNTISNTILISIYLWILVNSIYVDNSVIMIK